MTPEKTQALALALRETCRAHGTTFLLVVAQGAEDTVVASPIEDPRAVRALLVNLLELHDESPLPDFKIEVP